MARIGQALRLGARGLRAEMDGDFCESSPANRADFSPFWKYVSYRRGRNDCSWGVAQL